MSDQLVGSKDLFQDISARRFSPRNSIYAFTTENVRAALVSTVGNSVLCVAGSGDLGLNTILLGAKHIDYFDVNEIALYWVQLKVAAIRVLSFEEFFQFFLRPDKHSTDSLKFATFCRIKPLLSAKANDFFEACYKACGYRGAWLRESSLFRLRFDQNAFAIKRNLYLDSKFTYDRLKALLCHVVFRYYHCSAKEIAQNLPTSKYSFIYLSNLADYVDFWYENNPNPLKSFANQIIAPLSRALSDGGELWAAYLYDHKASKLHSKLYNAGIRIKYFSVESLCYEERYFPSVIPETEDACIILSKGKHALEH